MSLYRALLATVVAMAISAPVFAEDAASATSSAPAAQSTQPADNSAMQQPASEQAAQPTADKANINKASVKELMKAGLKANQAKAIVAYRKKHGDFKSLDDLANIKMFKKMSEKKMKALQDKLSAE